MFFQYEYYGDVRVMGVDARSVEGVQAVGFAIEYGPKPAVSNIGEDHRNPDAGTAEGRSLHV